ncbi:intermembrane phospholipid transport protein YdbH family protein [Horticoccus sp. 23ND18S-11]|uniref:intermembrane phospholipid transport protein YdbH family protein n=1 Tax=Horticoccus sp. 23ND18S-11 TaxID=3391832 RepID=UPI0039C9402B
MFRIRSRVFAFVGGVALACPLLAASNPWKLPPLDGNLAGEFLLGPAGVVPELKWTVTLQAARPRERAIAFSLEGPGFKVRGDAVLDPRGEGAWRIDEAEIDLAEWFSWVAPHVAPEFAAAAVTGTLRLNGAGTWQGGVLGGRATVSLRDGKVDDVAHKVLLEGISVDVEISDLAARRTEPAQVFTWRSGRYDVVALGVGRIEFALEGDQVRVNEAAIDVFGGELTVPSLVMSTKRPEFDVIARMNGVAVDQMLFLLPPILAEAKGRLDGDVALRRDATGIQIGNGRLSLRQGETADLRLAVKPGWLSTSLPPEIVKYFPGFKKMENGEIPIRARVLDVTLTPRGDAQGRTAWVHLAGGPNDPELTAPIDANVNVRGPLEELVKIGADLGTNSRLRFSGAR